MAAVVAFAVKCQFFDGPVYSERYAKHYA